MLIVRFLSIKVFLDIGRPSSRAVLLYDGMLLGLDLALSSEREKLLLGVARCFFDFNQRLAKIATEYHIVLNLQGARHFPGLFVLFRHC